MGRSYSIYRDDNCTEKLVGERETKESLGRFRHNLENIKPYS